MAAWGDTGRALNANGTRTIPWPLGPDARGGDQPIGTRIIGNIVNDIGVWQKQSSMWFQALTAQTLVKGNVRVYICASVASVRVGVCVCARASLSLSLCVW